MTTSISLKISSLLSAIRERLSYAAGKSAGSSREFFRLHACEADDPMLAALLSEALSVILVTAGPHRLGYSVSDKKVSFTIFSSWPESRVQELSDLLKNLIIAIILWKWALLTGWDAAPVWQSEAASLLASLADFFRPYGPLLPRNCAPF